MNCLTPNDHVLDLGSHTIPKNETLLIEIKTLESFYIAYLLIPPSIVKDFRIDCIKIGENHQFLSTGPLPAVLFRNDLKPFCLKGDFLSSGDFVKVIVINMTETSKSFSGCLAGPRNINSPS